MHSGSIEPPQSVLIESRMVLQSITSLPRTPRRTDTTKWSCKRHVRPSSTEADGNSTDDSDDSDTSDDTDADATDAHAMSASEAIERGRRTLKIAYWSRSAECLERKWTHMDKIDGAHLSREAHILATTLAHSDVVLEPNMFPYDTPPGIEHWTLWSCNDMTENEVERCVHAWIMANAPHVRSWNFDENPSRSIDVFHVHVYLQVRANERVRKDSSALQSIKTADA